MTAYNPGIIYHHEFDAHIDDQWSASMDALAAEQPELDVDDEEYEGPYDAGYAAIAEQGGYL